MVLIEKMNKQISPVALQPQKCRSGRKRETTALGNFMILYDGREGSSAIVSMLSGQNGVSVPVFEDLDRRGIVTNHPGETLADVIDGVYQTGRYDAVKKHRGLYAPGDGPIRSVGFKARLFGNAKSVAPILKARDVTVFVLFRRNFDDVASSLYLLRHPSAALSKIAAEGVNGMTPQFRMLDLSEIEKKAFLKQYNSISTPANQFILSGIAKRITGNRNRVLRDASIFAEQGIKIVPIAYEDFVADRVAFVRQMMNQLGFPPDWPISDRTKFDKVNVRSAASKLHFSRVHPAWVSYCYHRRSYGQILNKLAALAEHSAA